jgi:hypothetical protein
MFNLRCLVSTANIVQIELAEVQLLLPEEYSFRSVTVTEANANILSTRLKNVL